MDRSAITFDWNKARAFLVAAEEGSLSAAARALGMNQPTLSRQVSAFENELEISLFDRTGRGLKLTPQGVKLAEHVRRMGEAANQFSLTASGQVEEVEGWVAISASDAVSTYILPPILKDLRKSEPGIHVKVVASNTLSDLRRREADIAIRHSEPKEPDLIGRKIRQVASWLYATPSYIESLGNPLNAQDLKDAVFIGFDDTPLLREGLNDLGLKLTDDNFQLICENGVVAWEFIKQGMGIGVITEDVAQQIPGIIKLPIPLNPILITYWLVAHKDLRTNRRIRRVFDELIDGFSVK